MRLILFGIVLAIVGCHHAQADDPAETYRDFAAAEAQGQYSAAWSLLSSATQKELTDQAKAIAKARGQTAPEDGRELAFAGSLQYTREITAVDVQSRSGDQATVVVTADGGATQPIRLVREQGVWRVDLTTELGAP